MMMMIKSDGSCVCMCLGTNRREYYVLLKYYGTLRYVTVTAVKRTFQEGIKEIRENDE